jgi:rhodanese-related sulfurtransferase
VSAHPENPDAVNPECSPAELKEKLDRHDDFLLLDVRTTVERSVAKLEPSLHIPLRDVETRIVELDPWHDKEIVCLCHHGVRSGMAQALLTHHGFSKTRNLEGGIDAYSADVDPGIPRY